MMKGIRLRLTENRKLIWLLAAILLLLAVITYALLGHSIIRSGSNVDLSIDLFSGEPRMARLTDLSAAGEGFRPMMLTESRAPITVEDETQIWDTDTQVDIFRIEYKNGDFVTAASGRGDHIIAPGTSNSYTFQVKNNTVGVGEYKLTTEAWVTGANGLTLPVEIRYRTPDGYAVGNADDPETLLNEERWEPVLALNGVENGQMLLSYGFATYTIDWRWPFESDIDGDGNIDDGDALDTLLGNMSAADPITLTIRISTEATYYMPEADYFRNHITAPIPSILNSVNHVAYLEGFPDGLVHPEAETSRAEIAQMFLRLLRPEVALAYQTKDNPYGDVKSGAWYEDAMLTLTKLGLLEGDNDGKARPNEPMTHAEFAVLCARLLESDQLLTEETGFTDLEGHWAKKSVMLCEQAGWMLPGEPGIFEDGLFNAKANLTRAEAATIINRILHRLPLGPAAMQGGSDWADNSDPNAWYYMAIKEASTEHDYRLNIGVSETWEGKKTEETKT